MDSEAKARFTIEVTEGEDAGRSFELRASATKLGRRSDNDIILTDQTVSGNHTVFEQRGDAWVVADAGSRHGTLVNDAKIGAPHVLHDGDQIRLGMTLLTCREIQPEAPAQAAPPPEESLLAEEMVIDESALQGLGRSSTEDEAPPAEKKIPWIPIASGVAAVLIVAVGLFFVLRGGKPPTKPKRPAGPAKDGNMLEVNPAFEQPVAADRKVRGWTFRSDPGSKWALDAAAGRGVSLQVTRVGEAGSNATDEAVYAKRIPTIGAKGFTLSAWVKSRSATGVHTLRLSWLCETDAVFREDLFAPPATGKTDWRQIRLATRPPGRATHMEIACVTVGATRSVWFDDVRLSSGIPSGDAAQDSWKTFRNISLALGPQGTFRLHKSGALFLWNGELRVETVQSDVALRQRLARLDEGYPQPEAVGEGMTFKGKMFEPLSLRTADFEQTARPAVDGLEIEYKIHAPQAIKMQTFTLSFAAHSANLTSGATVGMDGAYVTERQSFAVPAATELTIGDGPKRTSFSFSQPVKIICKHEDEKQVFQIAPDVDMRQTRTELSLRVLVRPASAQRKEMAQRAIAEAARAAEERRYGDAFKAYQKILSEEAMPEEVRKTAFSALTRMRVEANMMLKDVRSKVDEAIQSGDKAKLAAAKAASEAAAESLEGTALAKDAAAILKRLDSSTAGKPDDAADPPEAQAFYKKALDHYERKSFLMAKILCNNVINKFADTPSAERAKRLLEQIKGAEAARVEAQRDVLRKMSRAKNLVATKKFEEAAKIYNEIIEKHPNQPAAEVARKGLQTIAEKMAEP